MSKSEISGTLDSNKFRILMNLTMEFHDSDLEMFELIGAERCIRMHLDMIGVTHCNFSFDASESEINMILNLYFESDDLYIFYRGNFEDISGSYVRHIIIDNSIIDICTPYYRKKYTVSANKSTFNLYGPSDKIAILENYIKRELEAPQ